MSVTVAIIDIDGAVADISDRRHLLDRDSPTRWRVFFQAAEYDVPLDDGVKLARELAAKHEIVWLTDRPEWLRSITAEWLRRAGLPPGQLIMHPPERNESSALVKVAQVQELARQFTVAIIVDDDPRVVQGLRSAGFPARLADWLPWSPSLGQQFP